MDKDMFMTDEKRTISLTAFRDIVDHRCCEYMGKYHVKPRFVKLPMWIYKIILKYHGLTVCGLALCPTISIEEPSDIEVF